MIVKNISLKGFNVLVYGSTLGLTTPSKSTLTKELKVLPLKILQLLHLMLQYCDTISQTRLSLLIV